VAGEPDHEHDNLPGADLSAQAPDHAAIASAPGRRPRRRRARSNVSRSVWTIRWFLAEFFVVLSGILVALIVNAWWEARADADREYTYLSIIAEELGETESNLQGEIEASELLFTRAQALVNSFYLVPEPPLDSLQLWWRFFHRDPQPTLGTLRALIETGDLRLVRDDSLRTALVRLGERSRYYDARLRKWENEIVGTYERLMPMIIAMQNLAWQDRGRPSTAGGMRLWEVTAPSLPDPLRRPAFVPTPRELLDDEATYRAAFIYMMSTWNHLRNQNRLLAEVRTTRELVVAAL
jgi:hypothetical protein